MEALGITTQKRDINIRMWPELEEKERFSKKGEDVYEVLKRLTLIGSRNSKLKFAFRQQLGLKEGEEFFKNKDTLKELYEICVQKMKYKDSRPFEKNDPEREVQEKLNDLSRKKVIPSAVIGNSVVDFFYPQHNLVLEIDGPVHYEEIKMRKDCHRDKELMGRLGIIVWPWKIEEIHRGAHELRFFFMNQNRISYSNERRLWRNIHAMNIAKQMSVSEISTHLNTDIGALIEIYKRLKR